MKTFTINTLGCKVNQYESRQISQLLTSYGLKQAPHTQCADLVVVNTCCVTHIASAKSRQSIRKAQKTAKNAIVLVAGCLPQGPADELKNIAGNVHIVGRKKELVATLRNLVAGGNTENTPANPNIPLSAVKIKDKTPSRPDTDSPELPAITSFSGQTRAFLKIQDGCDAFCTYCIIPKIRTKVCNKPVKTVLAEAGDLVRAGHKEIVLTGIFLGAYGQNTARRRHWDPARLDSLADLLDKTAQTPHLARLRLSSLEPADVTDRLIDVICSHENIALHLHLPLQSGSDRILKRMCRQYRIADFRKTIEKLKSRLDRPAITTDIIVGFPGETDDDFAATVKIAKDVAFSKTHVFSFSARKGTPAARMQPAVPAEVIKERSRILHELDRTLQQHFRRQFIGEEMSVIIETLDPPKGRCQRYFIAEPNTDRRLETGDMVTTILQ
ncbi:MAG: tRNA (N(6)-L-threonylcarbamoyladenosine(37)-C(2))-methylthiotransferase MtaB [Planctomycetota bacterium]|nr:MAG: tRNA (N(6)-L-threonylcarbamoyladenosine(37)-C(2))-methylthiotransferase MtaB [Planctomycetota bacterium]